MGQTPHRRRFFKLLPALTVFLTVAIVVTIFQSAKQLVHDRETFIKSLKGLRGVRWEDESPDSEKELIARMPEVIFGRFAAPFKRYNPTSGRGITWWRASMGDKPYWLLVYYPTDDTSADLARELFPEAIIMVADDPWQ
jgi:hypothetical protein